MYNALIIDDEADARGVLRRMLNLFCPQVTLIDEVGTAEAARERVNIRRFDLIFLDIRLRRENGLALANYLIDYCPNLIFVTAYDHYAVEAYRTDAIDYLLKPVDPDHLQKAVSRAKLSAGEALPSRHRIILSTKTGLIVLSQDDIIRVEGDGNYCTFFCTGEKEYFVSKNLAHYEEQLAAKRFYRVHQSHLVHLGAIREYQTESGRSIVLRNGDTIPIARRRREGFFKALQAFRG